MPSSLRGRYALLLVVLLVFGQVCAAVLVRQFVLRPRVEQLAENIAGNALAIRAGLLALPPSARAAYVQAFNAQMEAARASEPAAGWDRVHAAVTLPPLERSLLRAVARRLQVPPGELLWRREAGGVLALRLPVEGVDHWIVLPGLRAAREFSGAWLLATIGSALAGLLAALWLLGRLSRPLERLERAARAVAAGQTPDALPERGPREIATVARSFNGMVRSLADADSERALMLAGVSHDLRTPLTKLRLAAEILGDAADSELAASMRRSVQELDAVIGQFLDYARAAAEEPLVPCELLDLAAQVQAAAADHGQAVAVDGVRVACVAARPSALLRAVNNLVENAFRHGRPPVRICVGADATEAWLAVCDAGPGIPPGDTELLKQPFRRGVDARSGPPGAGLGLAIVERIARQHGGRLELERAAGGGFRARLVLPLGGAATSS